MRARRLRWYARSAKRRSKRGSTTDVIRRRLRRFHGSNPASSRETRRRSNGMNRSLVWSAIGSVMVLVGLVACGESDSSDGGSGSGGATGGAAGSSGTGGAAAGSSGASGAAGSAGTAGSGPADHTESMSGVMHKPGKEDPLANCTACHGADLTGGASAPSCYDCHNSQDHTIDRNGVMHRTGQGSSCSACHGPSNGGGLGPACTTCH